MSLDKTVLHVIPSVGPNRGGPTFMVRTLARGLARCGVETHIATTDDNGHDRLDVNCSRAVIDEGVTYWHFRRQSRFYTFSWPLTTWLAKNVKHYDVVHIHALFSYAALPAAYSCQRSKVPYIVRPLGTLNRWGMLNRRPTLKKLSFRLIETPILRHASRIHYTSEQERNEAMSLDVHARSVVVPNPLPATPASVPVGRFRQRHPEIGGRRILLFLSRFDRKKGLDLLLEAFAKTRKRMPEVALVLAGGGDAAVISELKRQAETLGIGSDIVWAGFLEGDDKSAVLRDADLFVLPSYSENFGIAVIEAMAAGLPVVVSDQVAIHTEVTQSRAGKVTACDADELCQAILEVLQDESLRADMGRRGQSMTKAYTPEAVARQLISIYEDVITESRYGTAVCASASR